METGTQKRKIFSLFELIFPWFFGKVGSFLNDQSNVARIFGVRNLCDFCCALQCIQPVWC